MARPWHEERDDCIYQSPRHQETSVPLGRRDEEKASSPLYTAEGLASRIRHAPSLGRMLHHRRLCLAVVIFSLASAAIFFGAAQLGVYDVSLYVHRPAPGQAKGHYAVDSEPGDDTQRQCTTWPVAGDGSYNSSAARGNYQLKLDSYAPAGGWKKPEGVRVVGVIFYGRRRNVDILDCYLQQNLARNGGYLDEVRFLVHTTEQPDLRYLEQLVEQTVSYSIKDPGSCKGNDYSCMWESLVEDDTIYVKIDDDIVYIHHDAIPQLVHTRVKERHPLAVSANLVNAPVTGLEHFHFGAIHPFMAEPNDKPSYLAAETWRPSEKPNYPEVGPRQYPDHEAAVFQHPPYKGHTWLLLPGDNSFNLLKTPVGINFQRNAGLHDLYIAAWESWAIGAQQQYSLLRNIELNQVSNYFFGRPIRYTNSNWPAASTGQAGAVGAEPGAEQLFDTQYKRTNIVFLAMWGHDIKLTLPLGDDDELDMTLYKPRELQRPFVVDTRSVVGHFSFGTQQEGIRSTDLLDRWRALANEFACRAENQKLPWDERCPGF